MQNEEHDRLAVQNNLKDKILDQLKNHEQLLDISELLTDEDIDNVNKTIYIKRHLMSLFKAETLIDNITAAIKKSDILTFANERSSKFIDSKRPIFSLKFDYNKIISLNKKRPKDEEQEVSWIIDSVYREVVQPFGEFIISSLRNSKNEDLKKIFNASSEEIELLDLSVFALSSIFAVKVDITNHMVQIEYLR